MIFDHFAGAMIMMMKELFPAQILQIQIIQITQNLQILRTQTTTVMNRLQMKKMNSSGQQEKNTVMTAVRVPPPPPHHHHRRRYDFPLKYRIEKKTFLINILLARDIVVKNVYHLGSFLYGNNKAKDRHC